MVKKLKNPNYGRLYILVVVWDISDYNKFRE